MKIALIIHSCDRYALLYKGFHYFFLQHWNFNVPIDQYYFLTEEKAVHLPNFQSILSGKGEWSDRLRSVLEELEEDYVLYFQEDMWLNQTIDPYFFWALKEFIETEKPKLIKLHSSNSYQVKPMNKYVNGFALAELNLKNSGFLMSHQVSLWERKFLIQQLPKNEHPWRNERKGTKRLRKQNIPIFQLDYFSENNKPPLNKNHINVRPSAYSTVSVNAVFNEFVLPYIKALKNSKEKELIAYANQIDHHYNNQITHDGKAKPRKEDMFKKIKIAFTKWGSN